MLNAVPKGWFSWDYTVLAGSQPIASIDLSRWREKGTLTIQGVEYKVYREGFLSGAFILESAGTVVARAKKPSAFRRLFTIDHAGRQYTLRAGGISGRVFVLLEGTREVGAIFPEGTFTRRVKVDLPEGLPLPVRVFIIWLAIILWRRAYSG